MELKTVNAHMLAQTSDGILQPEKYVTALWRRTGGGTYHYSWEQAEAGMSPINPLDFVLHNECQVCGPAALCEKCPPSRKE